MILTIVFMISFFSCLMRVLYIQNSNYSLVADMQFNKSITLGRTRGYIYDRNLEPLVNEEKTEKVIIQINSITKNMLNGICDAEEIKNGLVYAINGNNTVEESEYIKKYSHISRYGENMLCRHIIGYTDNELNGVAGIEKAFDRILKEAGGEIKVSFNTTAGGSVLAGEGITLSDNNYDSPAGISLTIDKDIQAAVEKAILNSEIECGACVVMDVNSFQIIASCSVPFYDAENIAASVNDTGKPFLNRALSAFPAGSVFKPFIAAAAIENGWKTNEEFQCTGSYKIGSNTFTCYDRNVHGKEDLNAAIEKSCNTFFISLGLKTGAEKIISTAEGFGFGKSIRLCSTLVSDSGNIPDASSVTSDSQLANLCFGQGDIMITPVQLAAAYSVLANKGIYKEPSLMKELIDENKNAYAVYKSEITYRAVSESTCEIINSALYNNMLNGTGMNGASDIVTSAGKTATAQTGRYDSDGNEILCTWFAGFFPYETPEYAVVIMNENGSTASVDCAPVFKNIIEAVALSKYNR